MKYAIAFILGLGAYFGIVETVKGYQEANVVYLKESQCVREYIAKGYERIDIKTTNGSCYYEPNGYYN